MSKRARVATGILLFCLQFAHTMSGSVAAAEGRPFLSAHLEKLAENAKSVMVIDLDEMRSLPTWYSPSMEITFAVPLSDEQRKSALSSLRAAEDFEPSKRMNECTYQPGLQLGFYSASAEELSRWAKVPADSSKVRENLLFTVLLCFNCDVWAIGNESGRFASHREVHAFGDSRAYRAELLKLARALFPRREHPFPEK